MDVANIYGHLHDKSELVIGVGNYNNIHGLACYYPNESLLHIQPVPEIMTPSVLQVILHYENPTNNLSDNKLYFSLEIKSHNSSLTPKYINVDIDVDGDQKIACASISSQKGIFTIDYSTVDKIPRSQLLAGTLYSLQTTFGEQKYIVSWKIHGFANGDLIVFLPTTWYENVNNICQERSGINTLIESLNQLKFKGYTTEKWCETASYVINCNDNTLCGDCLGPCQNNAHICWPHDNKFICGSPENEPNMFETNLVSFADTTSTPPTSGTTATVIAIIVIFVIVAILAWGLTHKYYTID
jgi:hypothetical protein